LVLYLAISLPDSLLLCESLQPVHTGASLTFPHASATRSPRLQSLLSGRGKGPGQRQTESVLPKNMSSAIWEEEGGCFWDL